MDLLFIVSTPDAPRVLLPLAAACKRRGARWGCFFTNDGVESLRDEQVVRAMSCADTAVACEHSWERFMGEAACPVNLGSQTNNSALVGEARKVISL